VPYESGNLSIPNRVLLNFQQYIVSSDAGYAAEGYFPFNLKTNTKR